MPPKSRIPKQRNVSTTCKLKTEHINRTVSVYPLILFELELIDRDNEDISLWGTILGTTVGIVLGGIWQVVTSTDIDHYRTSMAFALCVGICGLALWRIARSYRRREGLADRIKRDAEKEHIQS